METVMTEVLSCAEALVDVLGDRIHPTMALKANERYWVQKLKKALEKAGEVSGNNKE